MAKIRWSHEAEQWLKEIYEYISEENPTAAEKVVSGIYDKAQQFVISHIQDVRYTDFHQNKKKSMLNL
ncbi:MAG: hypothetical protein CSA42_08170 [Gammaproteobacteria bacterium]|nr:MAG: hypothetical protein CSA42_08170 [Gammaproteobacteria bacterium]